MGVLFSGFLTGFPGGLPEWGRFGNFIGGWVISASVGFVRRSVSSSTIALGGGIV